MPLTSERSESDFPGVEVVMVRGEARAVLSDFGGISSRAANVTGYNNLNLIVVRLITFKI